MPPSPLVQLSTPSEPAAGVVRHHRVALTRKQRVRLDDWRIRAGLYEANKAPSDLPYIADASLGVLSQQCRDQREKLLAYRPGLLKAPDPQLAAVARRYDRATRAVLHACVHNDPVALHHAEGAQGVAASTINLRYARLLGEDPATSEHVL